MSLNAKIKEQAFVAGCLWIGLFFFFIIYRVNEVSDHRFTTKYIHCLTLFVCVFLSLPSLKIMQMWYNSCATILVAWPTYIYNPIKWMKFTYVIEEFKYIYIWTCIHSVVDTADLSCCKSPVPPHPKGALLPVETIWVYWTHCHVQETSLRRLELR